MNELYLKRTATERNMINALKRLRQVRHKAQFEQSTEFDMAFVEWAIQQGSIVDMFRDTETYDTALEAWEEQAR